MAGKNLPCSWKARELVLMSGVASTSIKRQLEAFTFGMRDHATLLCRQRSNKTMPQALPIRLRPYEKGVAA